MGLMNFIRENTEFFWMLLVFLGGWILPVPQFKKLGEQAAEQLPPKLTKMLSERLRAFERGLMLADVNGDTNLVDNDTVKNELKKVKLDLGLKE